MGVICLSFTLSTDVGAWAEPPPSVSGRSQVSGPLPGAYVNGRAGVTFRAPSAAGGSKFGLLMRSPKASAGYRAAVTVESSGRAALTLSRVRRNHATVLASRALAFRVKPGQSVRVQGLVTGVSAVTLKARAWRVGTRQPGWQLGATDTSSRRFVVPGRLRAWSAGQLAYSHLALAKSRPSLESTGVPAGTALKAHYGDITVRKAGTVLRGLDIHGFVDIKAPNVRIVRSIVRGGRATYNRGIVTNYGYSGLVVKDSDLIPSSDSVWQDGMKGSDFTLIRVRITGNVDSVKVQGDNVTVEDSLLENTHYFASDPNQGGGPTHNDGVQVQSGTNVRIVGNNIHGSTNFAVLGGADIADTRNLLVEGNWLDGGHCTMKLEEDSGHQLSSNVVRNKFGPRRAVSRCALVAVRGSAVSAAGNVWEDSGGSVPVIWTDY
jgi:hypothetical protein